MKQILIVDDDVSVLSMAARALSDYEVFVARDGVEALAMARYLGRCDLLITDYMMSSMCGDELIGRLREHHPTLKVLMVTGHADILEREAPEWWATQPHLAKPFHIHALRDAVNQLIGA
jgi:CheY-like chemotaxis protein